MISIISNMIGSNTGKIDTIANKATTLATKTRATINKTSSNVINVCIDLDLIENQNLFKTISQKMSAPNV